MEKKAIPLSLGGKRALWLIYSYIMVKNTQKNPLIKMTKAFTKIFTTIKTKS